MSELFLFTIVLFYNIIRQGDNMNTKDPNIVLKFLGFALILNIFITVVTYFTFRTSNNISADQLFNLKLENYFEVAVLSLLYVILLIIGDLLIRYIKKKRKRTN